MRAARSARPDPEGETMAKGQKRSNKEIKKPKQEKAKAQPAASSLTSKLQDGAKSGKK